jgi:SAM-dependent methyltransferase
MDGGDALFDGWAEYYDQLYAGQDLDDVEFYVDLATSVDGPVLELACGTGRVYLELLAAGVDADGLDASREMLDRLESKAADRGLEPTVWQGDMRTFDADREYAAILLPFRSILHLHTIEDQLAALERIRDHLQPGGRLALNTFVPDHGILAADSTIDQGFELDGDQYRLHDETETVDPVAPIIRTEREFYRDGELLWETEFDLKPIYRREMELLVRLAGFSEWEVYGDFDRSPLTPESDEQVWVVER